MRCPTCKRPIARVQLRGGHGAHRCVFCVRPTHKAKRPAKKAAPPKAAPPKAAPPKAAPKKAAPPKAAPPKAAPPKGPKIPQTLTEINSMKKTDLTKLAESLDVSAKGLKDEILKRLTRKLKIKAQR